MGPAPWGTHFCQFYGTKSDLVEILVPYFKAGLEQDEFCMWITSPPLGAREAREALARAMPDLDSYERRGRIEILPHTEWYLAGGSFDQDRVLKGWVDKLEAALARGCAGLRLSGNTFWLEKKDWRGFAEYEAAVDAVLGQYRMLALCTYSLDRCGAAEVADVIRNHQFALIKRDGRWELLESLDRRRMRESEERYRQLFENLSEGFAVHEMLYDADGAPLRLPLPRAEPGLRTADRAEARADRGSHGARGAAGHRAILDRDVRRGRQRRGIPARFESLAAPLGRHYEVLAFRPRPGQFATLFFDVTERRSADEGREQLLARLRELQAATEAALQQAENGRQLLEAVMQALPVGVAITDTLGGTLQHNEAFDRIWRGPRPTPRSVADYAAYKAWWADSGKEVTPEQWASSHGRGDGRAGARTGPAHPGASTVARPSCSTAPLRCATPAGRSSAAPWRSRTSRSCARRRRSCAGGRSTSTPSRRPCRRSCGRRTRTARSSGSTSAGTTTPDRAARQSARAGAGTRLAPPGRRGAHAR